MRIAHVITRLILGGAQENTVLSCEDLIRIYRDDVLLVTGPALGPEGSLMERARAGGVPMEVVPPLRRPIHPGRDLASYLRIKRILRDFQPDIVHTHSAKAGVLGRAAASRLGVPAIVHGVHGAPFHPYQGRGARAVFRACERWAAPKCHAFISVADAMTDLMVEAGVAPREKFTTIYSGMEVEPFLNSGEHRDRVRRQLGYKPEHVVVGKVARLFHLKGHEYVIRAARQVVDAQPNARFLLVGDGLLAPRLRRQIAAAGLGDHFQFTGLVPPEQIPGLIAAMDVVVHASLREGLARVLPQALIAGKPVVSYDVDGAREVVLPHQTGYLLPPKRVAEMADALIRLAADPALRDRLGSEGRRRFTDTFRHERMTEQIRALYERLLAG
ncbi:MAG: glycosyl transferase family 1 [Planctomycetes bacterium RBG_16_64_12]|nr:MAG: glycosyl transferase family 1 [Planctomycetes bacterium RBG_16_64_12]